MIIGFVIWDFVCLVLFGIGIGAFQSEKPVGFWSGAKPPEVKNVKKYNHPVGILWLVYAGLLAILGVSFLFLGQNSAGFVPVVFGSIVITIGFMVSYLFIEKKYKM